MDEFDPITDLYLNLYAENERLKRAILNQAGDNLCRFDLDGATTEAKALPEDQFLESCRRFRLRVAEKNGEVSGCATIAQLEAEIVELRSRGSLAEKFSREWLIWICERASSVPHREWSDRDSSTSIRQVGECWSLLRAGCEFEVCRAPSFTGDSGVTDARTIWLDVRFTDFSGFEHGESNNASESFYLPTPERLDEVAGKDWY